MKTIKYVRNRLYKFLKKGNYRDSHSEIVAKSLISDATNYLTQGSCDFDSLEKLEVSREDVRTFNEILWKLTKTYSEQAKITGKYLWS